MLHSASYCWHGRVTSFRPTYLESVHSACIDPTTTSVHRATHHERQIGCSTSQSWKGFCRYLRSKTLGQILSRLRLASSRRTYRVCPQLQVECARYRHPASLSERRNDQTSGGTLILEAIVHPSRALLTLDGVSIPVKTVKTRASRRAFGIVVDIRTTVPGTQHCRVQDTTKFLATSILFLGFSNQQVVNYRQ